MKLVLQYLLLLFVATISTTVSRGIPRLSPFIREPTETGVSTPVSGHFETFYYNQTLDHFNFNPESYATFPQKYVVNSKFWGGANVSAPILAYLGAEGPIDGDLLSIGFLNDNAPRFRALTVYIEHRYYGESNPAGSMEESVKNETTRGYFNSAQAIADYAEILTYLKNKLNAPNSPVIVVGGSYGGELASWFRLKYPHIALGALASSAPILYYDDITPQDGYYSTVSDDFRKVSESCYTTIKNSWDEIDRIASQPNGLFTLTQKFNTCMPLKNSQELKNYLDSVYCVAAQYNAPPRYPTTQVCRGIDGAANATDILDRVAAGIAAYRQPSNTCINTIQIDTQTDIGWRWQTCSEMVLPIGISSNESMFPSNPFNLTEFNNDCKNYYGVAPRPHWITTYYGGHDIKLILKKFGSNIIFSNGLRDPYSTGGVLEDISDSILAVHTNYGSHCLDIVNSKETDPIWLILQRKIEVKIIAGWLKKYYKDLLALEKSVI